MMVQGIRVCVMTLGVIAIQTANIEKNGMKPAEQALLAVSEKVADGFGVMEREVTREFGVMQQEAIRDISEGEQMIMDLLQKVLNSVGLHPDYELTKIQKNGVSDAELLLRIKEEIQRIGQEIDEEFQPVGDEKHIRAQKQRLQNLIQINEKLEKRIKEMRS